jgi:DNA (cytosine-5)-methyltransferase 1
VPTFGSLFAGIGGIDLGLERAGWECRWQVEWDAYCQRVLAKHWPDVPRYGDITAVDWSGVERVDLLAGGFPCQPFSQAGKRLGTAADRWLWPEFARAIRELRPRFVLVENVPGLLARRGGMGDVLGGLAELGYDAEWESIPAAAVGAPHLRYRVWVVAYADSEGEPRQPVDVFPRPRVVVPLADADRSRPQGHGGLGGERHGPGEWPLGPSGRSLADQWLVEPDVGRLAHGVPDRVARLRALGNAVVPQVVEWIGRRLLEAYEAEREVA